MPDFETFYNLSRDLSSWAWLIYTICYLILTILMSRVAREKTGSIFQWPIPGRWILTFHYAAVGLVFLELTIVFLLPRTVGIHFNDYAIMIMSYLSLVPLLFLPALIRRLLSIGLTDNIP